jgi:hypothetical protein
MKNIVFVKHEKRIIIKKNIMSSQFNAIRTSRRYHVFNIRISVCCGAKKCHFVILVMIELTERKLKEIKLMLLFD